VFSLSLLLLEAKAVKDEYHKYPEVRLAKEKERRKPEE